MIIAFGHESGVGKDQSCIFLIDHLRKQMKNREVTRVGFADKLYDFCYSVYGWAGFMPRTYYQQNPSMKEIRLPKLGCSPREMLIRVGNHMRLLDDNIWLYAACRGNKVGALQIITDLRKINEFNTLNGFPRVKIARPGYQSDRDSDIDLRDVDWDYVIVNDGSLNALRTKIVAFCDTILIPAILGEI